MKHIMVQILLIAFSSAIAQDTKGPSKILLYDTVKPAEINDVSPSIVAESWKQINKDGTPEGDAVLLNGSIAVVVRKKGGGVDLYAKCAEGWIRRAGLAPAEGGKTLSTGAIKAVHTSEDSPTIELTLPGVEGGVMGFALKDPVLPAVKVSRRGRIECLRILAPCRLGILPDFFADDLVVDAQRIPVERAEVPSDNFFLHMLADGASILAAVWEKNEKDLQVNLSGKGENRVIASTDIFFSSDGAIWVAVLEQKGIWYSRNFTKEEGIKGGELDWDVPFIAKWKGNFTREDGLIESQLFCIGGSGRNVNPIVRKGGKLRASLNPSDPKDPMFPFVGYNGIMVIYPTSRTKETPLDRLCLDDLLRECLGSQPCAYILDVSARTATNKGIFTCSYGATFGKIIPRELPRYERVAAMTLKEERAFVRRQNEDVLIFITHIQDRINVYVSFLQWLLQYLDEQEKAHPELADFIGRMRNLAKEKMFMYGGRYEDPIRKADGAKRAEPLLAKVYKALEVDTPECATAALGAVPAIPQSIGDPQDLRVAQLRVRTKQLRTMAMMEMAVNPSAGEIAREIRKRTEEALRNPSGYERPVTW